MKSTRGFPRRVANIINLKFPSYSKFLYSRDMVEGSRGEDPSRHAIDL